MSVFSNLLYRAFGKPFYGFKVIEKQLEPAVASRYYRQFGRQSSHKIRPDGIYKHITADFMEDFALIKQDII